MNVYAGQDGLTGSAWGDWANYADSPLRAFEDELGVQAQSSVFARAAECRFLCCMCLLASLSAWPGAGGLL